MILSRHSSWYCSRESFSSLSPYSTIFQGWTTLRFFLGWMQHGWQHKPLHKPLRKVKLIGQTPDPWGTSHIKKTLSWFADSCALMKSAESLWRRTAICDSSLPPKTRGTATLGSWYMPHSLSERTQIAQGGQTTMKKWQCLSEPQMFSHSCLPTLREWVQFWPIVYEKCWWCTEAWIHSCEMCFCAPFENR